MFGLPSLERIIILATLPVLLGFIYTRIDHTWRGDFALVFSSINGLWGVVTWFSLAYADWKRGYTSDAKPIPNLDAIPASKGFASETAGIKLDTVRMFNRALIDMRNSNLQVKMSETFWLTEKVEDRSRWNRIDGGSRDDFVDVIERGIALGAYHRIDGRGTVGVKDWRLVRMLEQGTPLPQISSPTAQN